MLPSLSQVGHIAIILLVIAGIIGIVWKGCAYAGITIPQIIIDILKIIGIVALCIVAILFLLSLAGV